MTSDVCRQPAPERCTLASFLYSCLSPSTSVSLPGVSSLSPTLLKDGLLIVSLLRLRNGMLRFAPVVRSPISPRGRTSRRENYLVKAALLCTALCDSVSGSTPASCPPLWSNSLLNYLKLSPSMTTGEILLSRSGSKRSHSSTEASCRGCSTRSKCRRYRRHLHPTLPKSWTQHHRLPSLASDPHLPPQIGDDGECFSDLGQNMDLGQEWTVVVFGLWKLHGLWLGCYWAATILVWTLNETEGWANSFDPARSLPVWMIVWASVASPI